MTKQDDVQGNEHSGRRRGSWLLGLVAGVIAGGTITAPCGAAKPPEPADAGCPATSPDHRSFPFPAGPPDVMVPDEPISATVCRYGGVNPPEDFRQLQAFGALTDGQLQQLVGDLNAVGLNVRPGMTSCPFDDAQADVIVFGYSDRPPAFVIVELLGCTIATNGTLKSMVRGPADSPGQRAYQLLTDVAGPPTAPTH